MSLLLLGGNSSQNKDWVQNMQRNIWDVFPDVTYQMYDHWLKEDGRMDFDHELEVLEATFSEGGPTFLLAKSVGIVLALRAIKEGLISPQKCVFLGLPLESIEEMDIDLHELFEDYDIPTLFIQKTYDPVCSFLGMKTAITGLNLPEVEFVDEPGDKHSYDDLDFLRRELVSYLKK